MTDRIALGIDCGGTHTDAAILAVDVGSKKATLLACAKTATRHDNLPGSIIRAIQLLKNDSGALPATPDSITIGTTLEINAIIEGRADAVGVALSAGPGLDPVHFGIGDKICIVPGGLDHRGQEVRPLYTQELAEIAKKWARQDTAAIICVGKFSPRNPAHELEMAAAVKNACDLPVIMGHSLSGRLNFPRRIATAYYSAAISRLHSSFLSAIEDAMTAEGINAKPHLLKADGGAIPFALSRREPAQSILSGPAASVMGALAMGCGNDEECVLLLDIGGTTTDMAMFLNSSPIIDRDGMTIRGRHTLVRSLASISIGIGGDSVISAARNELGKTTIDVGPERRGPAMAFGGDCPALLDALNVLDGPQDNRGNISASVKGIMELAASCGMSSDELAAQAAATATAKIMKALYDLVEGINSRPIYTLAGLHSAARVSPQEICLIGGPAQAMAKRIGQAAGIKTIIAPHSDVANAIGAALTSPTASIEIYADTGKGTLSAPAIGYSQPISPAFTLKDAENAALRLLGQKMREDGTENDRLEITEAELFATLDDRGRSAKDMRIICQAVPDVIGMLAS